MCRQDTIIIFIFTVLFQIRTSSQAVHNVNTHFERKHIPGDHHRQHTQLRLPSYHEDYNPQPYYDTHVSESPTTLTLLDHNFLAPKQSQHNSFSKGIQGDSKDNREGGSYFEKSSHFSIKNSKPNSNIEGNGGDGMSTLSNPELSFPRSRSRNELENYSNSVTSASGNSRDRQGLIDSLAGVDMKRRKEIQVDSEMYKRLSKQTINRNDEEQNRNPYFQFETYPTIIDNGGKSEALLPTSISSQGTHWSSESSEENTNSGHSSTSIEADNLSTLQNGSNIMVPQNSVNDIESNSDNTLADEYVDDIVLNEFPSQLEDESRLTRLQNIALILLIGREHFADGNTNHQDISGDINIMDLLKQSVSGMSKYNPVSRDPGQPNAAGSKHILHNDLKVPSSYSTAINQAFKTPPATIPKRSLRSGYFNPIRYYTHLSNTSGMSRVPVGKDGTAYRRDGSRRRSWRNENSLKRGSQRCNFRRITVQMLMEYLLTNKLCGSNVVRIRFGLGR